LEWFYIRQLGNNGLVGSDGFSLIIQCVIDSKKTREDSRVPIVRIIRHTNQ